MTLGQLNILEWVSREPRPMNSVVGVPLEVPPGVLLPDVVETLAVLVERHEGLRTTYTGGARPSQRVEGSGTLSLERYAVEAGPQEIDHLAIGTELCRRLDPASADPLGPPPFRIAIATRGEQVCAAAMAITHLSVDNVAIQVLRREFAEMISDPAARVRGATRHQPLDQAAAEQSPASRRSAEAALRHWEQHLSRLPQCLYPRARAPGASQSLSVRLRSVASALALERIATRVRLSRSSVFLAALSAVLARRAGRTELVFSMSSGNRFESRLRDYVGSLTQAVLVSIALEPELSFDQLAQRAWTSLLRGTSSGRYDVFRRCELVRRAEQERGLHFELEPLLNNVALESRFAVAPDAPAPAEVLAETRLSWEAMPHTVLPMRFDLLELDRAMVLRLWSGDAAHLPASEMEALVYAVERLLVAAAQGDLTGAEIARAIDLEPISRGSDWLLIDSCWIELGEVQRLLEEALAPNVARVFHQAEEPLVAYVAASDDIRTPEQAHARCLAALPGRFSAMTPRRYMLWKTSPPDPSDVDGWQGLIAAGSGRSRE